MRSSRADKVLLQSIKTLTFHKDAVTKARRTTPIPQLTCKGKACKRFQPDVVQCTNTGDDGLGNVQWKCEADMPSSFRFGPVEVSCEGYNRPGDRYVLQGSCGLEYNLVRVDTDFEAGRLPYVPGKGVNWACYPSSSTPSYDPASADSHRAIRLHRQVDFGPFQEAAAADQEVADQEVADQEVADQEVADQEVADVLRPAHHHLTVNTKAPPTLRLLRQRHKNLQPQGTVGLDSGLVSG
ncbi:hypothetical protein QFC20_002700 [Naganishia adeliensis]|uniref:Uncharacterized protein n=1 Tax=Naganishia adeliensis TaxID=92952 RepID=A0ACC2WGM7_9TREE|nr:hypothetical protein QFC20_002700 [Naganishia adeliensis]